MLPTHELVILTKLRNNRARIVDFLLILQFGLSLIFFGTVSKLTLNLKIDKRKKKKNVTLSKFRLSRHLNCKVKEFTKLKN